jgi:cytochrome c-type biogenesis protein CcmE
MGIGLLKNKKFIIGALVVVAAIGFLSVRAFAGSATYYYEVGELLTQKSDSIYNTKVKVRGFVEEGSMVSQAEGATLNFQLADQTGDSEVPVVYQGAVPDSFKEGGEVVCEGRLTKDGVFHADALMPKCPSKYTPASGSG